MDEFSTIWIEQCDAARGIRDEWGTRKALGYLVGEKLLSYIRAAEVRLQFFVRERPAVKRRRQSPASRSKPRTTRAKYDCLEVLSGDEAQIVLKDLLSSRPDLISDARRAANALLATVSFADVAAGG